MTTHRVSRRRLGSVVTLHVLPDCELSKRRLFGGGLVNRGTRRVPIACRQL